MNPHEQLRFTKTIKIDPELRTEIGAIDFSAPTLRTLTEKGFETLTPVQSQSFESVYSGVDVVARSRTGTGKTFAFGLPLFYLSSFNNLCTKGIQLRVGYHFESNYTILILSKNNIILKEIQAYANFNNGCPFLDSL